MNSKNIQTFWDDQAATFDDEPDHGLTDPATRQAWQTLLEGYLGASRCSVVDLGCGTGSVSELLAQRGHRVIGVDLSPNMIERARAKATASALEIDFIVGDVQTVAVPEAAYGAVLSRHVFWAMSDPDALVARWSAPLADDGMFIAIEGVWAQVGTEPEVVFSALQARFEHVVYTDLSAQSDLWGKDVTDHRYAIVGSRPRGRTGD